MSWFRLFIFAAIGMMLGGPTGAGIGALMSLLASVISSLTAPARPQLTAESMAAAQNNKLVFFTCLFSMLGKLAKSDGVVSRSEIAITQAIIKNLQLNPQDTKLAQHIFNEAKENPDSIYDYADQYATFANKEMRVLIYEMLWRLATADQSLGKPEEVILRNICHHLKLDNNYFNMFHAEVFGAQQANLTDHYLLLGCHESDSVADIKKAYRRAVKEYHPDKLASQGLPESFTRYANEQMQKINEAYREIMKTREA